VRDCARPDDRSRFQCVENLIWDPGAERADRIQIAIFRQRRYCTARSKMGFQVYTREAGVIVLVTVVGRLTLTDSHTQLRDEIHVASANGKKRCVLNLARVEFIDSYGIGELVRCYSLVRRSGGEMKLASVSKRVLDLLEISRLTTIFETYLDESAALQAFGRRTR